MLGKLVNKFKKHSIQEETAIGSGTEPTFNNTNLEINTTTMTIKAAASPLPQQLYRRSARISALHGDNNAVMVDSGTESDDDELEQLDSNLNRAHSSDLMGSSPPNLTSSPPLASEIETNSWDSTGCESGIVLHDRSGENSETSQDNILDEVISGAHCVTIKALPLMNAGKINEAIVRVGGHSNADAEKAETGAFRPVTRRRYTQNESNQDSGTVFGSDIPYTNVLTNQQFSQQPPITQGGIIGEKRRYENITPKFRFGQEADLPSSPIATRLRSYNSGGSGDSLRETLVAARRQPVKLIIHNPAGIRRTSLASTTSVHSNKTDSNNEMDAFPTHPLKRGRMIGSSRPSLDFEKMRERLVVSNVCGIGSQEFVDSAMGDSGKDIEKRKHDWALTTSTSSGRRCFQHQQVRCQQTDCTFRTVEYDGAPAGGSGGGIGTGSGGGGAGGGGGGSGNGGVSGGGVGSD